MAHRAAVSAGIAMYLASSSSSGPHTGWPRKFSVALARGSNHGRMPSNASTPAFDPPRLDGMGFQGYEYGIRGWVRIAVPGEPGNDA
jgi:hypothetical protein